MRVEIYTDGSSKGNPGFSSYAFVVCDEKNKVFYEESKYLGIATNNIAEYEAVLAALKWLESTKEKITAATLLTDSEVVIRQLTGEYKIKYSYLRRRAEKISDLVRKLRSKKIAIRFLHIPREENLADESAREAWQKVEE